MSVLNWRRDNLRTCFVIVGTGLMTALVTLVLSATTQAATYTWDGGHTDNKWIKTANWVGDPALVWDANTDIVFNALGAAQLTNRINGDLTMFILAQRLSVARGGGRYTPRRGGNTLGNNAASRPENASHLPLSNLLLPRPSLPSSRGCVCKDSTCPIGNPTRSCYCRKL